MEKTPLVTVLMTAYNAERFIGEAIESILDQSYKNIEFIIVDDGSKDRTYRIMKQYSLKDKRIHLLRLGRNSGPSLASNAGLRIAKGDYIVRMDADDIAFPKRIEHQVSYLLKYPDTVLLGGQVILIDEKGKYLGQKNFPLEHGEIYQSLFAMNPISHPGCIINLKLLPDKKVRYHNKSVLAHDLELIFELVQYGKLANLSENILYYRQYPNSLSLRNPKETFRATLDIRKKAVRKYGYQADRKGKITNFLQTIIITILPTHIIYPLFRSLRFQKAKVYTFLLRWQGV